jgi:hypothetical protein
MLATIFEKLTFRAPSVLEDISKYLINEYMGLDQDQLLNKSEELRCRTILAWEYVQNNPGNYIPLNPDKYFDLKHPNGFLRTEGWYKQNQRNVTVMEENRRKAKKINFVMSEFKNVCMEVENNNSISKFRQSEKVLDNLSVDLKRAFYKIKSEQ